MNRAVSAMLATTDPAADRRLNLLLGVSVLVAVGLLVFASVAIPNILSSASTTQAIRQGNELAACRAGFRSTIDDGTGRLHAARARLDRLTNEGLEALVLRDEGRIARIVRDLPPARDEVEARAADLESAHEHYGKLVELSRTNPEAFLELCNGGEPAP